MTTITRDGNHIRFYGHAGYGTTGNDIVCAGVSTLAYTLMGCLEDTPTEIHIDDGIIDVRSLSDTAIISQTFDVIWEGCLLLSNAYHDYVIAKEEHLN